MVVVVVEDGAVLVVVATGLGAVTLGVVVVVVLTVRAVVAVAGDGVGNGWGRTVVGVGGYSACVVGGAGWAAAGRQAHTASAATRDPDHSAADR